MSKNVEAKAWEGNENTPKMLGIAATMLRELSEPRPAGEYVKTSIDRAAKLAGLEYWRAFDLWYSKARKVEPYEIEQIAAAIQVKNEKEAANELRDLKSRLLRLEARLAKGDANFHSPTIDHARELVRQLSGQGRTVAG
jgi:ribosomal protein L29